MGHWRMDYAEGVSAKPERTTKSCKVSVLYRNSPSAIVEPNQARCCLCNAIEGEACRLSDEQHQHWMNFNERYPSKRNVLSPWTKLRWIGNAISAVLTAVAIYYIVFYH